MELTGAKGKDIAAMSVAFWKKQNKKNRKKHSFLIWQTMFIVDDNYVPLKPLGRGSYGVVCSFVNTKTMERVAIKKINDVFNHRVGALRALREMVILRNVHHPNVISLKDVMVSNSPMDFNGQIPISEANFKDVYMVQDLMDTDLHNIIKSPQPLSNDHCKFFFFQLLKGLKYLHSVKILHRDLKPENLLVNANWELKICDFGLARSTSRDVQFMTEYVVTRWYRAPELLPSCGEYGAAIDVWSVGCILAELLGRQAIFRGSSSLTQLMLIIRVLGTQDASSLSFINNIKTRRYIESLPHTKRIPFASMYPHADPLAIDLLERMLVFNPTKRITVNEAFDHPYLAGLVDPTNGDDSPLPIDLNIDDNMEEGMIRQLMWTEMINM